MLFRTVKEDSDQTVRILSSQGSHIRRSILHVEAHLKMACARPYSSVVGPTMVLLVVIFCSDFESVVEPSS